MTAPRPYLSDPDFTLWNGDVLDVLATLPDESIDCCVTSPPYWGLRDYGVDGQIGLEASPAEFVQRMVDVFRQVRRVLAPHGTCWINLGSSYFSGGASRLGARPDGNGDTAPQDSRGPDSAYPDLCDGCAAARSNHNAGSSRPLNGSSQPWMPTGRGIESLGSGQASPPASPLGAPASTNQRSSTPLPGECSHCSNCGACLAVLGSSSRDARLCARTEAYTNGTDLTESESRNQGTGVSGMAWMNYSSRLKAKDLVPIPWMVALALQEDGWYLRSDIVWFKPNPMPSSVTDRPTVAHEYVFLLTKQPRYWFDQEAVREPHSPDGRKQTLIAANGAGVTTHENYANRAQAERWPNAGRNIRSVWEIATQPYAEAHFATFPQELPRRAIKAGCPELVCRTCGKARERIVERGDLVGKDRGGNYRGREAEINGTMTNRNHGTPGMAYEIATVGWSDCGHGNYRPGIVLDPFLGSGTTALVAREQGRHSIGIELNPDYAALCARRLQQQSLFADAATSV